MSELPLSAFFMRALFSCNLSLIEFMTFTSSYCFLSLYLLRGVCRVWNFFNCFATWCLVYSYSSGGRRAIAHSASRPRSLIQCLGIWPRLYFKPLFSNVSSPFVNLMLVSFTSSLPLDRICRYYLSFLPVFLLAVRFCCLGVCIFSRIPGL